MTFTPTSKLISKKVAEELGNYVYALVDPRDNEIFYVGKAKANNRAVQHLLKSSKDENEKRKQIDDIRSCGLEPRVEILRYRLDSEQSALEVEAAIIDAIGLHKLTNSVRGHDVERGRLTLNEAVRMYDSQPVDISSISEPLALFFIHNTYHPTIPAVDLYNATRQFWYNYRKAARTRLSSGLYTHNVALAIVYGVVVAAYTIDQWHPGGTTPTTRPLTGIANLDKRWEFTGKAIPNHQLLNRRLIVQGAPIKGEQVGYKLIP
jgi:hypothetical protein